MLEGLDVSPHDEPGSNARPALALAYAILVLAAPPAAGEGLFLGGDSFPLAAPAGALCVDDFDGDGRPDVAVVHAAEPRISVVLGDSAGLLGAPATYPVGLGAVFVTSGDLDGDDRPDLIVVNGGVSTVSILLNDGAGRFLAGTEVSVGRDPRAAGLADFDGDGDLDLVTTNFASGDLAVLLGDGTGAFPADSRVRVGDNPHDLTIADLDGDGASDVAVAHTGAVSWFRGLRDGSFERAKDIVLAPDPRVIAAGDFDADGRVDLAVIDESGTVLCLRNEGAGTFPSVPAGYVPGFTWAPGRAGFLVAIDFDRDGFLDLVTEQTRILDSGLRVIPGGSGLAFGAPTDVFLDTSAADLGFDDFDRDGLVDAVVTRFGEPGLAIYRGTAPGRLRARRVVPLDDAPRDLVAVDLGQDGLQDLVALGSSAIRVIRTTAGGGFEPPLEQAFPGRAFQNMASADFDSDGRPDLALTDVSRRSLLIAFLDDQGSVARTEAIPVRDLPTRLATGDFDADGLADAAVLDQVSPSVTVVLGPGKGREARAVDLPVGSGQLDLSVADADGDGALDIAVSTRADLRVAFGDGAGGFPRSLVRPDLASSTALALADVDADGVVELAVVESGRRLSLFGGLATGDLVRRWRSTSRSPGASSRPRRGPGRVSRAARGGVEVDPHDPGLGSRPFGDRGAVRRRREPPGDRGGRPQLGRGARRRDGRLRLPERLDPRRHAGTAGSGVPSRRRGWRRSSHDHGRGDDPRGAVPRGARAGLPGRGRRGRRRGLQPHGCGVVARATVPGRPVPEPPGPDACGPDPSVDDLEPCGGACAP